jgi:hypothetical protein
MTFEEQITDKSKIRLQKFLDLSVHEKFYKNQWVEVCEGQEYIKFYLRASTRRLEKDHIAIKVLDIATIELSKGLQNKGIGMQLINFLHSSNPYQGTYIENVLNSYLENKLIRDGWKSHLYANCYYKNK